jgi:hypothetical protein
VILFTTDMHQLYEFYGIDVDAPAPAPVAPQSTAHPAIAGLTRGADLQGHQVKPGFGTALVTIR